MLNRRTLLSSYKDKRTFANMSAQVVDESTVVVINKEIDPDLPFVLGPASSAIVEPRSAGDNMTKPTGTGPFRLENWVKGSSVMLARRDGYRNAAAIT